MRQLASSTKYNSSKQATVSQQCYIFLLCTFPHKDTIHLNFNMAELISCLKLELMFEVLLSWSCE